MWRLNAALAGMVSLAALFGSVAKAQSALLLGLRRPCPKGPCQMAYRTLWIARHAGKVQIVELPDLILPRHAEFWRVGVRTCCDREGVQDLHGHEVPWPHDAWFAGPAAERPVVEGLVSCPANADGSCGGQGIKVMFLNSNYISLEERVTSECGMHPDGSGSWSVRRLGDHDANPLAYSAIEGQAASAEYESRAAHALMTNAAIAGDTDEDREIRKNHPNWSSMSEVEKVAALQAADDNCFPKHDDQEWYIGRDQGRWHAYGAFDTHRLCGVYVHFELPLSTSFAGPATAPVSLDSVSKQMPGAYDAFWSPGREMVVVLVGLNKPLPDETAPSQTSLEVFSPRGQDMGKPIITMPLMEYERAIMAEWASGSGVAQWPAELTKIKAQGVVSPLLRASPQK